MISGDEQRSPQTHLHPGLVRDTAGRISTFGTPAGEWFTPQVPAEENPAVDVAQRARAATAGRLRAFAGELPTSES